MLGTSLHSTEYNALRKWLKKARKDAALTLSEVAEKLDIHHSIVGKLEIGDRHFDLFEFISYCEALEVDPAEGFKVAYEAYKQANKNTRRK